MRERGNSVCDVLPVRAGALQFKGKGGKEMWGLLERNRLRLQKKSTDDEQAAGAIEETD